MEQNIADLETPCLLLEKNTMLWNIKRLKEHLQALGVPLRAHLKTSKSVEVARLLVDLQNPMATVSTLKEAEIFATAGIKDIIYAVSISPDKLPRVKAIRKSGCNLSIILESEEQAVAISEFSKRHKHPLSVFIEINCDGHRSGVSSQDGAQLVKIATIVTEAGCILKGVLTHAGESYNAKSTTDLCISAEKERLTSVTASSILRANGFACPIVSVGSTPTAHFARNLEGVTEVRAGVFVFFDLFMCGLGVCTTEDIAISVLTTVIGHQKEKGWMIVDAGWMAMSRDRGTANQNVDQGYGVVCMMDGTIIPNLIMVGANQEHGILAPRADSTQQSPLFPIGTKLRILPNHACATASQFDAYKVINEGKVLEIWSRFGGW